MIKKIVLCYNINIYYNIYGGVNICNERIIANNRKTFCTFYG